MELARAREVIGARPDLADLTITQYESGIELLQDLAVIDSEGRLESWADATSAEDLRIGLAERLILLVSPVWLADADHLFPEPPDLPLDAADCGVMLGIDDLGMWSVIHHAAGKFDAEIRASLGAAGEAALVQLLSGNPNLQVDHVALRTDSLGFDVVVRGPAGEFHLEVKSSRSRANPSLYLTRHEYAVSSRDPSWLLVVVVLGPDDQISLVGSVPAAVLPPLVPQDVSPFGKWETAKLRLPAGCASPGVPGASITVGPPVLSGQGATSEIPIWLAVGNA